MEISTILLLLILGAIIIASGIYAIYAERFARLMWLRVQYAELEAANLRDIAKSDRARIATLQKEFKKAFTSGELAKLELADALDKIAELEKRCEVFQKSLNSTHSKLYQATRKAEDLQGQVDRFVDQQNALNRANDYIELLRKFMKARCLVQRPKSKWFAKVNDVMIDWIILRQDRRVEDDDVILIKPE